MRVGVLKKWTNVKHPFHQIHFLAQDTVQLTNLTACCSYSADFALKKNQECRIRNLEDMTDVKVFAGLVFFLSYPFINAGLAVKWRAGCHFCLQYQFPFPIYTAGITVAAVLPCCVHLKVQRHSRQTY